MQGQTQFLERADHAVGFLAAQHAGMDLDAAGQHGAIERDGHHVADLLVLRAGDDLDGSVPPHVHLTDPHVVGIRVAHHFNNSACDNVLNAVVQVFIRLNLGAGERHCLGKFPIAGCGAIHKLVEPFSA